MNNARTPAVQGEIGGYERGFSGVQAGAYHGFAGGAQGATPCTEALFQADPANTGNVGLGFGVSGNTPITLIPGASITLPVRRLELLLINVGAGDALAWIAFIAE